MVKILSQAGKSLADIYDVVGSIAGIEQLFSRDVQLLHEMGSTIFSERYTQSIRQMSTGNINQSTVFDIEITDLPLGISRILGVVVFISTAGRINFAGMSLRDPTDGREMPIFVWDTNVDNELNYRVSIDGGAAITQTLLQSVAGPMNLPNLISGADQPGQGVPNIILRGTSSAFGAGTVNLRALVLVGLTETQGVSNYGLPVPSW